ncbi:uncharacterized protein LOC142180014 [Nicotiana tabacum]|uniref:Uncharacterized protein LOC142180014 n=1 Tax=Nicotiana tabacum TaxID=4097 RepID=A0AC58UC10_TOBAC
MQFVKPFKFLNFWIKHDTFQDVVRQKWNGEDIVRVKAILFEDEPTIENMIVLQIAQAELKKYLSIKEQFWKQKELISTAAVEFSSRQFTQERDPTNFDLLNNVPSMVTMEHNLYLCKFPTFEEVKKAVFTLSGDSASGPNGFTGLFYQYCWDIVGEDIFNMVQQFYRGALLPKSVTRTNLVLLPKKPNVKTFSDLRPISLSNFINKGISIFENTLLTQEIVSDIRLRGKPANVVIKLDMAKAYDRVSWKYLLHVLRRMGFAEYFINMIWNLLANNWYYVLVNGQSSGFFESTRGVKQGDPLSPALFILSAEVLTRCMNKLFEDKKFIGYGMPKWTKPLNHLAYANDTIIFTSADTYSLTAIVKRRKEYYNDLVQKVKAKLHSWKGKPLSFRGKSTLISSVLQSLPTHILSVLDPPKNIMEYLHKIFARFFWSTKEEGRSRYWTKWENLCLPKEEGGIGFRSLFDVSKALFSKLWWRFRTTKSMWSNFIWNKYCKKEQPTLVQFREGSHVWRKMLEARGEVEHEILWVLNRGTTSVWHENWTGLGSLYHVVPPQFIINEELDEVVELTQGTGWNDQVLDNYFPEDIANHIREEVYFDKSNDYWDTPIWIPTASGKFTLNNARQLIKHRHAENIENRMLWTRGLPFKISFFLWRLWRGKLPTDDI